MEEMKGLLTAINAMGEKINMLEDDLRFAGYKAENLEKENADLRKKLEEVRLYISRMEEE